MQGRLADEVDIEKKKKKRRERETGDMLILR